MSIIIVGTKMPIIDIFTMAVPLHDVRDVYWNIVSQEKDIYEQWNAQKIQDIFMSLPVVSFGHVTGFF